MFVEVLYANKQFESPDTGDKNKSIYSLYIWSIRFETIIEDTGKVNICGKIIYICKYSLDILWGINRGGLRSRVRLIMFLMRRINL